jgi:hypothetical protein
MLKWCGAGVVVAVLIGWLAASIHATGHAPVGIISLGVGVTLGVALGWLAALLHVSWQRRLIFGTIAIAIFTVLAEHAWLYADFRRQWHDARLRSPQVAMFRQESPWSPAEYFAHESTPQQVALWSLDAALITLSAVGTVFLLRRMPK